MLRERVIPPFVAPLRRFVQFPQIERSSASAHSPSKKAERNGAVERQEATMVTRRSARDAQHGVQYSVRYGVRYGIRYIVQ